MTKLQLGAAVCVPACTLVLCLHLFKITRLRAVVLTDEKAQACIFTYMFFATHSHFLVDAKDNDTRLSAYPWPAGGHNSVVYV